MQIMKVNEQATSTENAVGQDTKAILEENTIDRDTITFNVSFS